MFERFSENARQLIVAANNEARRVFETYIREEHLLLGLAASDNAVVVSALGSHGLSLEILRQTVDCLFPPKPATEEPRHVPFTPEARRIFERASMESQQLGHNYIGCEHILLGLLKVPDIGVIIVFRALNVDPDALRQTALNQLGVNA